MKIVAWSSGGRELAAGGTIPPLKLVDPSSGQVLSSVDGITTQDLAWSPDSRYLAVANISPVSAPTDTLRIWDTQQKRMSFSADPPGKASSVAWSRDGRWLAVGGGIFDANGTLSDAGLTIYDTASWQISTALPYTSSVLDIDWAPNGSRLAFLSGSSTEGSYYPVIVDVAADEHLLLDPTSLPATRTKAGETGPVFSRLGPSYTSLPRSISWSPDGKFIAAAFSDGYARVWDPVTNTEVRSFHHANEGRVLSLAWSPDSKKLVSGGDDGTAKVWDALTGQQLAVFEHPNTVDSVAWSPDGTLIAVACEVNEVWLWSAP